jgi:hypothetical protein
MKLKPWVFKLLFSIFILTNSLFLNAQGRKVDAGIKVLNPIPGETIESRRQAYVCKVMINNNGPDTIKWTDFISLKITFGNVIFKPPAAYIGNDMLPGGSDTFTFKLVMKFDTDNDNVPFCAELSVYAMNNDSIKKEIGSGLLNNKSCITVNHRNKLSISFKENKPISIFPNPTNSKLYINKLDSDIKDGNVSIFDLSGRLVLSQNCNFRNEVFEIDNLMLSPGIYNLKFEGGGKIWFFKLVVE